MDCLKVKEIVDMYVPISISDLAGDIIDCNEAFCFLTKYTKEELIGKPHSICRYQDTPSIVYEKMWEILLSDEVYSGELVNRAKDNTLFHVNVKIHPRFDDKGKKIGYISVRENITDRKKLEVMASYDELTGVYNRSKFDFYMKGKFKYSKRYASNLSLLIFDIDHFKLVNDIYGHLAGDLVLKSIAQIIKESIRESDIVARWGGEEFAVIVANSNRQIACTLAENIRNNIQKHSFSKVSHITVSCGISQFKDYDSCLALFEQADTALYKAKQNGRNCIVSL
ncbi:MAG: diguanylate cyclase [Sulfurimonas sp.]|nr:MAG: diguanylate cyclase [Sulfurimonas sp.]